MDVLHDRDVELARQAQDGEGGQQRHGPPVPPPEVRHHEVNQAGIGGDPLPELARSSHDREGDDYPYHQEGRQLDQRFERHGQDKPSVMLVGVDVADAEQDRENSHGDGHEQHGIRRDQPVACVPSGQRLEADGDRLQLERQIGHDADDCRHRDESRHRPAFAIAGGQEIGDRDDVFRLGDPDQPSQHRPAKAQHQDGA